MHYPFSVSAIDVGGTKIAHSLVVYDSDEKLPRIVERKEIPTLPLRGGEAVLADVIACAQDDKEMAREMDVPFVGVGISAGGVISPHDGSVLSALESMMPGWGGIALSSRVSDALGVQADALNDVQAHALGETRWGCAHGCRSALVIANGTGLGGAIVIDGKVVQGIHGAAGHLGNLLHPRRYGECIEEDDFRAETIMSGTAIAAAYQGKRPGNELDDDRMGAYISKMAEQGEQQAIDVLEHAGRCLGEAIGAWCAMVDPEYVILSGSVVKSPKVWHDALREGFASQAMPVMRQTPIMYATLGGDAPLIGAAEHIVDKVAR